MLNKAGIILYNVCMKESEYRKY